MTVTATTGTTTGPTSALAGTGAAYEHLAPLVSRFWGPDLHYGFWDGPQDRAPFPVATGRLTELVAERLGVGEHDHVLDLGCGNGRPAVAVAGRYAARVTGVDVDAAAVARAREHARAEGVEHRVRFLTAAAPDLPFADRSFDAVLVFESSPHFELGPLLTEVSRVLAPGGRLVIETPCLAEPGPTDPAVDAFVRMLGGLALETVEAHHLEALAAGLATLAVEDITERVAPSFPRLSGVLRDNREEIGRRYGDGPADLLLETFGEWASAPGVRATIMTFAKPGTRRA